MICGVVESSPQTRLILPTDLSLWSLQVLLPPFRTPLLQCNRTKKKHASPICRAPSQDWDRINVLEIKHWRMVRSIHRTVSIRPSLTASPFSSHLLERLPLPRPSCLLVLSRCEPARCFCWRQLLRFLLVDGPRLAPPMWGN